MRYLAVLIFTTLSGCATGPTLEVARYKPSRGGVIKMPISSSKDWEKRHKDAAAAVMKRFCAPERPEISEISRSTIPAGSTSTIMGGTVFTRNNSEDTVYVHFECSAAASDDLKL